MKTTHDQNGSLWDSIWYFYRDILSKGGSICVHKVVAHAEDKQIPQDPFLSHGNSLADKHADAIADTHKLDSEIIGQIRRVDQKAWLIMRRMLAVVKRDISKEHKVGGPKYGPVVPAQLDAKIMALGHVIVHRPPMGYLCSNCGDTWT